LTRILARQRDSRDLLFQVSTPTFLSDFSF
jgi:hypothetical protein